MASFLSSIILPLAVVAVAFVLLLGLINMMRGGSPNRSQNLMRLRVRRDIGFKAIMDVWLYLHVPLTFMLLAALLAQHGFTGSLDALEAPFGGFMSTLHGQHDAASILEDLGTRWETARVGLKAYAACASAHTTIDGVLELRRRGLSHDNFDRMTVRMSRKGHLNIGFPYRPGEVITAQMNGFYAASVALLDGEAFLEIPVGLGGIDIGPQEVPQGQVVNEGRAFRSARI